jgi:hypothetical protein
MPRTIRSSCRLEAGREGASWERRFHRSVQVDGIASLAQRLGVAEADAATVVPPLTEVPAPVVAIPAIASASPLVPMTGRNGTWSAPPIRLHSKSVRAARQRITPSKMACWSLPHSRSSFCVRPTAAVSMKRMAATTPCLLGAGCDRISASTPARQPCATLSHGQRPDPPVEAGYPRSGDGHRCTPLEIGFPG